MNDLANFLIALGFCLLLTTVIIPFIARLSRKRQKSVRPYKFIREK